MGLMLIKINMNCKLWSMFSSGYLCTENGEGVQIALAAPSDYQLCKRGHFSTPKLCMK